MKPTTAPTEKPGTNGHTHKRNGHAPTNRLAGVAPPIDAVSHGEPEQATPVAPAVKPPEGRTAAGTFGAGNKFARGNPTARRMAALRNALMSAVDDQKLAALGAKLYESALAGDWTAAKLLLLYAVGKPVEAVAPDELDLHEFQLMARRPNADELEDALFKKDPVLGVELATSRKHKDVEELRADVIEHLKAKRQAARGPFADFDDEDYDLDDEEADLDE
jgi:hypothetical protein